MTVREKVEVIELTILDPRRPGWELWEECRFLQKGEKIIINERPRSKVQDRQTPDESFAKKMRNEFPFKPEDYNILGIGKHDSGGKTKKITLHLHSKIFVPNVFDHVTTGSDTKIRYKWVKVQQ